MTATTLLAELADLGVTFHADGGRIRLDAPTGVLTLDLLAAVKSCKGELLSLLTEPASYADREWARFLAVAKPMADGGWYDPIHGAPEMPSGVSGERWDAFVADFAHLGKAVRT